MCPGRGSARSRRCHLASEAAAAAAGGGGGEARTGPAGSPRTQPASGRPSREEPLRRPLFPPPPGAVGRRGRSRCLQVRAGPARPGAGPLPPHTAPPPSRAGVLLARSSGRAGGPCPPPAAVSGGPGGIAAAARRAPEGLPPWAEPAGAAGRERHG